MNSTLICAIAIVNIALICYSAAILLFNRKRKAANLPLILLSAGILFDVTSTLLMITGSSHSFLSSHGLLGYTSLLAMIADGILLWNFRIRHGAEVVLPRNLQRYTRVAYGWWIIAYTAGIIIVTLR